MRHTSTGLVNPNEIEERFVFNQEIKEVRKIQDDEGQTLAFQRNAFGNHVIFTHDEEGIDVAIEHCIDGTKIFHLSQDSKGLPAMHEFKPDGTDFMYLLDADKKLEKMIQNKTNGDKITNWFYINETLTQEERQTDGIVFKLNNAEGQALVWLHPDGSIKSHGEADLVQRLKSIFNAHLDGVEV